MARDWFVWEDERLQTRRRGNAGRARFPGHPERIQSRKHER